jgi:glycerol-3-phosphate O-acyltransferase / dihydroxyacetone phosphate acyltransferase
MGYRLVRRLARLLLALFYRRIEIVGLDRLPATGPLIVAANHQNALVDPALLLATLPRRLRPVAKAPLFGYPVLGWLLRLAGAIPVHRRQDPGSDAARNAEMFAAATATLAGGGAVLIFPEGVSQAEPRLMPLRTGAARMVLATPAGGVRPTLLPVGLVFHEPGTFRAGWAVVLVGEPVGLADGAAPAGPASDTAVRALTDRLDAALRRLIVEAHDRRLLRLAEAAHAVWRADAAEPEDGAARAAWLRSALRGYRYLETREPERLEAVIREVEAYRADLEATGLAAAPPAPGAYRAAVVRRYAVREGVPLLLGLPLAAWGVVLHAMPYQLTRLAARLARPAPDVEATAKLLAGLALYPLGWLAEGWVAWRIGGPVLLSVCLASLAPAGFFALTWWERLARVRRDTRAFLLFLVRRDLHARLRERRRTLLDALGTLAARVPAPVLAGEGDEA